MRRVTSGITPVNLLNSTLGGSLHILRLYGSPHLRSSPWEGDNSGLLPFLVSSQSIGNLHIIYDNSRYALDTHWPLPLCSAVSDLFSGLFPRKVYSRSLSPLGDEMPTCPFLQVPGLSVQGFPWPTEASSP